MRGVLLCLAGILVFPAFAGGGENASSTGATAVTNAPPDFATVCGEAWLKGVTERDCVRYQPNEEIKFLLSFEGVTNAVPAGKYFIAWKRTGDDGVTEEGKADLAKKKCECVTKRATPGFVRLSAQVVTADGKPFRKKRGGNLQSIGFEGGAGVAVESVAGRPEPKPREFDALLREAVRKGHAVPFKKVERTPVAAPKLKDVSVYSVSVPCAAAHPVTGYLVVPVSSTVGGGEGAPAPKAAHVTGGGGALAPAASPRYPVQLGFRSCDDPAKQPLPSAWEVPPETVLFVMSYNTAQAAEPTYYPELLSRIMRALEYLKTLPEWNGRDLVAEGRCEHSQAALMAGGCGQGVTKVICYNVALPDAGAYDPLKFARRIPTDCLVDITRAALGEDNLKPLYAAQLWNALACEKRVNWMQGMRAWDGQHGFRGRDVLWEKLAPVSYHDLDLEHAKGLNRNTHAFEDLDLALRDRVVFEAIVDPTDTKAVNGAAYNDLVNYVKRDQSPFTFYLVLPDKRVKDKVWLNFLKVLTGEENRLPNYPIYVEAGMTLPKGGKYPWYNVADVDGVLRYSGPDFEKAGAARAEALRKAPPFDPVFAYAPLGSFAADFAKPTTSGHGVKGLANHPSLLKGQKLGRYIEGEMRKAAKGNPARVKEAEHLLHGLRQARDVRLDSLEIEFKERPGRALVRLADLLAEWPDLLTDTRVKHLQDQAAKKPEVEKLAKLERELVTLLAWKPQKPLETKKRDAEVTVFRQKLERYIKSKDVAVEGEARLILTEFETPQPQPAT